MAHSKRGKRMQIKLRFIHHFVGRSKQDPTTRNASCVDEDVFAIPELTFSDFQLGSTLGNGARTYYRDSHHWSYYGCGPCGHDPTRLENDKPHFEASIDTLNLLTGNYELSHSGANYKSPRTLSRKAAARHIDFSARENDVINTQNWISENLAIVDGFLMIRVDEPSITLKMHPTLSGGQIGGELVVDRITLLGRDHDLGIHLPLSSQFQLWDYAQETARADLVDANALRFEDSAIRSSLSHVDETENMHLRTARSLIVQLSKLKSNYRGGRRLSKHYALVSDFLETPVADVDETALSDTMDSLSCFISNSPPYLSAMIDVACRVWSDRPVATNSFNNIVAPRL
jgi:hypothetical protein